MRILWLCNIMLPRFARAMGVPYSNREGWLTGCYERLIREPRRGGSDEKLVELGVCCPVPQPLGACKEIVDGVTFYGFLENLSAPEVYDSSLEERFRAVIRDFKPDIVHIFGTEFPHTLAMVRAFDNPEHTLIGIQGLCCSIADAYMADLPYSVQKRRTFRDRYRRDSLEEQQKKFQIRAQREEEALQNTLHVTGRTSFDRRITSEINPDAVYHFMNETMRPEFYEGEWKPESAEPHSIFMSQGDYPLKGFHYMLQAMPAILERFPDARLYVAGNSIIGSVGGRLREKKRWPMPVWISSYGLYLRSLIRDNHLEGHVIMLGRLSAEEMKAQYLRSNVYVCPSAVENSPNSLCEAMLLGMPVVAAKVGGIGDLCEDGEEGILFPGGRISELAEGIKTVFCDSSLAAWLGRNARERAMVTHSPDTNFRRLVSIYRSMV
ncbi:MAG: glycosyltransferase family 4 protein [Lachnospiraceae bacterium]|nr:glycosyltransferase family 4 protein [Lachnospiraceae bacterium]